MIYPLIRTNQANERENAIDVSMSACWLTIEGRSEGTALHPASLDGRKTLQHYENLRKLFLRVLCVFSVPSVVKNPSANSQELN